MQQGIDPETYFSKVLYTKHQAIEVQVRSGALDGGADYNRNRNAMIEAGLIKANHSVTNWQSPPLPNEALAVSKSLFQDEALVTRLQNALGSIGTAPTLYRMGACLHCFNCGLLVEPGSG